MLQIINTSTKLMSGNRTIFSVSLHQTCDMLLIFQVTEAQQHYLEQRFHLPIYESYVYLLNAPEKINT